MQTYYCVLALDQDGHQAPVWVAKTLAAALKAQEDFIKQHIENPFWTDTDIFAVKLYELTEELK